jgi:5-hydroxyisourate hydrolase-like protein (transthyretin family)
MYTKGSLVLPFLAFILTLAAAPRAVYACVVSMVTKDVATQFQVMATDRGEPASGVEYVLRRGGDECRGEVLAKSTTDYQGKAKFGPIPKGPATLCTVDLEGQEYAAWSLNIRAKFAPETNLKTSAYGRNPLPVRAAGGVIRLANSTPSPEGQRELMVKLMDVTARKTLYETAANAKGEFFFSETVAVGHYYLVFGDKKFKFIKGGLYVEVRPDARYASLNLDATISDCGMSAMQREPEEPTKVAVACGRVFDSRKTPASRREVMLFDEAMKLVQRTVTDKDGKFQFSPQNAGHYLIYVPGIPDLPARREIKLVRAGASAGCPAPLRLNLEVGYSD